MGLNQWVLSDPFLMDDVNEDNRRIDEELGRLSAKSCIEKLKTITTTASNVTQIDIDVSDINFNDWQYVFLDAVTVQSCNIRANNNQYGSNYMGFGNTQWITYSLASVSSGTRLIFLPHMGASSQLAVIATGTCFSFGFGGPSFAGISTLNFVASGGNTFSAGNKFTFWGVK